MSYPAAPTYWLEPTGETARALRRYSHSDGSNWDCPHGYHEAIVWADRVPTESVTDADGYITDQSVDEFAPADPRWPAKCDHCDYQFTDRDAKQTFAMRIYMRVDTEQECTLPTRRFGPPDAPPAGPGACWSGWWLPKSMRGPDGVGLVVCLPNGDTWQVDSQASNCTRKDELHECWVRHGDPRECRVTVDKNGDTCAAGAGSIQAGDYHGFLRDGVLTAG